MRIYGLEEQIHVIDDNVTVEEIIKDVVRTNKMNDPFYIFDVSNLVYKIKFWQQKLPRVKPFYAVKCNENAFLLEILAAVGMNFDCTSRSEINQILNLGVDASRIIFNNTTKVPVHIKYAMNKCVNLTTFDSEIELYKIKSIHPTCKLIIQICCDFSETQYPLNIKFGCDPFMEAPGLLLLARNLGLSVVGVSFHIGSRFTDPVILQRAISTSAMIFQTAQQLGFMNMYLLNIGGGFSVNENISLSNITDVLNEALDEWFPEENDVIVIAEPGRYFAASSFTLATKINSIKKCSNDGHIMYFINDGVYGSFNNVLYDGSTIIPRPLKNYPTRTVFQSSIWGPICDGQDKIIDLVNLPLMQIGDWIIFDNMGAYTISVVNRFNKLAFPNVFAIVNRRIWHTLKNIMPISEEHFTSVPIVAIIKMIQSSNNDDTSDEDDTCNEDDDSFDENNEEWPNVIY